MQQDVVVRRCRNYKAVRFKFLNNSERRDRPALFLVSLDVPRDATVLNVVWILLLIGRLANVNFGEVPAFNTTASAASEQAVGASLGITCYSEASQLLFHLAYWHVDPINRLLNLLHLVWEVEHLEIVDERLIAKVVEIPDADESVASA